MSDELDLTFVDEDGMADPEKVEEAVNNITSLLATESPEQIQRACEALIEICACLGIQDSFDEERLFSFEERYDVLLPRLLTLADGEMFEPALGALTALVSSASQDIGFLLKFTEQIVSHCEASVRSNAEDAKLTKWCEMLMSFTQAVVSTAGGEHLQAVACRIMSLVSCWLASPSEQLERTALGSLESIAALFPASDDDMEGAMGQDRAQMLQQLHLLLQNLLDRIRHADNSSMDLLESRLRALEDFCTACSPTILQNHIYSIQHTLMNLFDQSSFGSVWPHALAVLAIASASVSLEDLPQFYATIMPLYTKFTEVELGKHDEEKYYSHALSTCQNLLHTITLAEDGLERDPASLIFPNLSHVFQFLYFLSARMRVQQEQLLLYACELLNEIAQLVGEVGGAANVVAMLKHPDTRNILELSLHNQHVESLASEVTVAIDSL
eukprot:TRINITY_DN2560_c0_g1_i2.p1 TRINITY_DN2560_c0_g1~~TRINITY_DN2560_c0_g1_i2.p1  ORF type:complete len:461 (+),score=127.49 TRINITY_DN2560_c0_g1_i2:60-1385(+)